LERTFLIMLSTQIMTGPTANTRLDPPLGKSHGIPSQPAHDRETGYLNKE
jgi:hypothetical protein